MLNTGIMLFKKYLDSKIQTKGIEHGQVCHDIISCIYQR